MASGHNLVFWCVNSYLLLFLFEPLHHYYRSLLVAFCLSWPDSLMRWTLPNAHDMVDSRVLRLEFVRLEFYDWIAAAAVCPDRARAHQLPTCGSLPSVADQAGFPSTADREVPDAKHKLRGFTPRPYQLNVNFLYNYKYFCSLFALFLLNGWPVTLAPLTWFFFA